MGIVLVCPARVSCMNLVSWDLDSKNIMKVVGESMSKLIMSSGFCTVWIL